MIANWSNSIQHAKAQFWNSRQERIKKNHVRCDEMRTRRNACGTGSIRFVTLMQTDVSNMPVQTGGAAEEQQSQHLSINCVVLCRAADASCDAGTNGRPICKGQGRIEQK